MKDEIISRLGSSSDPEKSEYYEAARIAVDAVIRFIKRYADELDLHSQNTNVTEERSRELKGWQTSAGRFQRSLQNHFMKPSS